MANLERRKHYANPPITEGLIDLRVDLPAETGLESFDTLSQEIKGEYPSREERVLSEVQFNAGKQVEASTKQTKLGYLFRSVDGKGVLQTRLDGFTFSRLKPYENWGALRDEAIRLWGIYQKIANPIRVTRVAVRYINQIDMPLPMRDFKDYLRTVPEVSPELPQELSAFLMQLQIPQEDLGAMVVLTQTMVPPPRPDVASVILDIDLFKAGCEFNLDDDVWNLLESFRDRKNDVFEGCITDEARRLFKPEY
jgi:uncharacterized protein (TIGR04255 family)